MSYFEITQAVSTTEINPMINVLKRNGTQEVLNLDKIHQVLFWACEDITGVSVSEIELRAQLQLVDGITTKEIHDMLIRSASDLISEDTPNYQYVAARLINYNLRKEVYGGPDPWKLWDIVQTNVEREKYSKELLESYTQEDFNDMDKIIKHQRDFDFTYAAMEQWRGKYLVRNRKTNKFYETPQVAYILIAAIAFKDEDKSVRMQYIKEFYDSISTFEVSLPTPIMAGLRTPTKQFSSCVLIESDDNLDSIIATDSAITKYVANKAGIGVGVGRIRAIDSEVRGGEVVHTGMIPFLRKFQSSLKSCSQGGVRGGAGTVTYPFWHYEFEELIVLKNNKGTDQNRLRQMDYCVQFNKLFYQRLLKGDNVTFFSPSDVPGLIDAFYKDQEEFNKLYELYENDASIRKRTLTAIEAVSMFMIERKETGRIYLQNIDHCNTHGSFIQELAPVTMTNLCVTGDTNITVLRVDGLIEDIRIDQLGKILSEDDYGTQVWSHNISEKEDKFCPISDFAMTSPSSRVMRITDSETGMVIRCTPEHKIYTKNRGYVMAKNLKEDDELKIMA